MAAPCLWHERVWLLLRLLLRLQMMVLVVSNFIEPWANSKLYDVIAEAQSDLFSVAVRSGAFMKLEDGLYVQVNEKLPGGELGGIFLSDTRTEADDKSGQLLRGLIEEAGHQVHEQCIVRDDLYQIRATVSRWISAPEIQVVITAGGTGLAGRDGTPEAVRATRDASGWKTAEPRPTHMAATTRSAKSAA